MTSWEIYWFTRLDSIQMFFVILALITGIVGFLWFVFCNIELCDSEKAIKTTKIFTIPIIIISGLIFIFIPSSKDMALIYVLPKIANSETVATIGNELPEISKMAVERLKEMLSIKDESNAK